MNILFFIKPSKTNIRIGKRLANFFSYKNQLKCFYFGYFNNSIEGWTCHTADPNINFLTNGYDEYLKNELFDIIFLYDNPPEILAFLNKVNYKNKQPYIISYLNIQNTLQITNNLSILYEINKKSNMLLTRYQHIENTLKIILQNNNINNL